jgi:hypothetical protein
MQNILYIILEALIISNIYATYCCIRSPYADKQQKFYQIVFVWLIPLVGAITVWHFSKPEKQIQPNIGNKDHTSIEYPVFSSGSDHGD